MLQKYKKEYIIKNLFALKNKRLNLKFITSMRRLFLLVFLLFATVISLYTYYDIIFILYYNALLFCGKYKNTTTVIKVLQFNFNLKQVKNTKD